MKSFKVYQYRRIILENGDLASGDYDFDDITIRTHEGYLNDAFDKEDGHVLPAVETHDGNHVEHWKNGVLHCEKEPAILDKNDNYEEWYRDGKTVPQGGNNGRIDDPRRV